MKYLTFILGAGASVPYGLPTGDELVRRVATHMLRSKYQDEQILGQRLELYDPVSIDNYLMKYYSQKGRESELRSYKAHIAYELMRSLQNAWLGNKNNLEPSADEKPYLKFSARNYENWLRFIIPELLDLFEQNPSSECPIKIISFNYDLSIESYVNQMITRYQGSREFKANFLTWVSSSIVHLYGQVGGYDWQKIGNQNNVNLWVNLIARSWSNREFVAEAELMQHAYELQKDIRIIGEPQRANEEHVAYAHDWISQSKSLVFSGYAFHPDNNRLLDLEEKSRPALNIIVGLYKENARTEARVRNLFLVGTNSQTKTNMHRKERFDHNQPANPTLNIHKSTTYNLLKDELTLNEHYIMQ